MPWKLSTGFTSGGGGNIDHSGFFFSSTAERDSFFTTSQDNRDLLETNIPCTVTVADETVSHYVWTGVNSPSTYDGNLWALASVQVSSGSIVLGEDGATISSGSRVINFQSSGKDENYIVSAVEYTSSGSETPFYYKLGPESVDFQDSVSDTILTDPLELAETISQPSDLYIVGYTYIPSATGTLRIQKWLGTDDTGPQILDFTQAIGGGEVGTEVYFPLPNPIIQKNGDQVFSRYSGVALRGGIQTSGPHTGLTWNYTKLTGHTANSVDFVTDVGGGGLPSGEILYGAGNSEIDSEAALNWDSSGKNLGVNETSPDTTLHVNSQAANTEAIMKLENAAGDFQFFRVDATPEGSITANIGDQAVDTTNGKIWLKETGNGTNTGWTEIPTTTGVGDVDGPNSSIDSELAVYSGVTGKTIKAGTRVVAPPGDSADIQLNTIVPGSYPNIGFYDEFAVEQSSIKHQSDVGKLDINSLNDLEVSASGDIDINNDGTGQNINITNSTGPIVNTSTGFSVDSQTGALNLDATNAGGHFITENNLQLSSNSGTVDLTSSGAMTIDSGAGATLTTQTNLEVESATGSIQHTSATGSSIFNSTSGDDQLVLLLGSTGTNSGSANFYVGIRDPEGLITAPSGSFYSRIDGTNSNLYQLHSVGTANTPWVPVAQGGGKIVGPGSSINNELVLFNGTSGEIVKGGSMIEATPGNMALLDLLSNAQNVYSRVNWHDSTGIRAYIEFQGDNNDFNIKTDSADLFLEAAAQTIHMDADNLLTTLTGSHNSTCSQSHTFRNTGADTSAVMNIGSQGANSAAVEYFYGTRNPNGIVTAPPGSMYIRVSGTTSTTFILKSNSSANTPWYPVVTNADGAGLPVGQIAFGDSQNKLNSTSDLFWDDTAKRLSVRSPSAAAALEINSIDAETVPIARFRNPGSGRRFDVFRTDQNPNGLLVATFTSMCHDQTNAKLYTKQYDSGLNTGWTELAGGSQLQWGDDDVSSGTTTRYLSPGYNVGQAQSGNLKYYRVPRRGTIKHMYVRHNEPNGNNNAIVYTVMRNGAATALSVSLGSNTTDGSNTGTELEVAQGDTLLIRVTKASGVSNSPNVITCTIGYF